MPLSPEDRKLVDRRLKTLDAQPAFQKLVQQMREERLQRQAAARAAAARAAPPAQESPTG